MLASLQPVGLVSPGYDEFTCTLRKLCGDFLPHQMWVNNVWECLNGVVMHGYVSSDTFGGIITDCPEDMSVHVAWHWRNGECYVTIFRG